MTKQDAERLCDLLLPMLKQSHDVETIKAIMAPNSGPDNYYLRVRGPNLAEGVLCITEAEEE